MNKLFLVLGPESSGNHLICNILQTMGAQGTCKNGSFQVLDAFVYGKEKEEFSREPPVPIKIELTTDLKSIIGQANKDIYLRRSVPYGPDWPNLDFIRTIFEQEGFKMYTIVVIRDWAANILSNYFIRFHHIEEAIAAQNAMWCWIGERLSKLNPFIFVNVSFLMKEPTPVVKQLELFTELKWPDNLPYNTIIEDSDKSRHTKFLKYGYDITDRKCLERNHT